MIDFRSDNLRFSRRQVTCSLIIAGLILFIVFGWVWWANVYRNPERAFWGMLNNSLASSGVSSRLMDSQNGQKLDVYTQLELGQQNLARSETTLTQNGNVIKTESIGTLATDYTRYISFKTSSKNSKGQPLNFSSVIGVWSKSPAKVSGTTPDALQHLFGQSLLGVVPIANLTSDKRSALLTQIRTSNVYVPDFSSVKTQTIEGQLAYIYNVAVEPVAYAAMIQQFAHDEDIGNLSELAPAQYQGASALQVKLAVGMNSRQLLRISYSGSARRQTYSGYGEQPIISIPAKTISTSALQQRLAKI